MSTNTVMVAAIDFGTTYAGYAFSARHEFEEDPLRVNASNWTTGSRVSISLKTSSCILFRPDRQFHSFGFDAEDKYIDLTLDREHHDWFFYKRFKMMLYAAKDVHRTSMLHDETGKTMPAMDVFAAAINYLKDHVLESCNQRCTGLTDLDVKWVLTVPAIWDDGAKQFMREAAAKAGIRNDRLILALEPEAASMFCKYLPVERLVGTSEQKISCFQPKSKYLVLDAGGGTVDITVHEVLPNGKLKELHKANGGPWGGTTIDQAFVDFVEKLIEKDLMKKFQNDYKDDFLDMLREFEVKKRSVTPNMDSKMTFRMTISLFEIYRMQKKKELRDAIRENPELSGKVTLAGDKMRVDPEIVKSFFENTCNAITKHLKDIFMTPIAKDTTAILMVGGFSESPMLQDAVRNAFPDKRVIIPSDAGLAVLKGAVIFGHDSSVITSRVAKYTYGLKVYQSFDPAIHPKEKAVKMGKEWQVQGTFSKLVEVGQPVSVDQQPQKQKYHPSHGGDRFTIKLYASPDKDPKYVDDPGCIKLGEVTVGCEDRHGNIGGANVWLVFGGTELEVHAENDIGEKTQASFNFLE